MCGDEREHVVGRMGDAVLGLEDMHGRYAGCPRASASVAGRFEPGEVLARMMR